MALFPVLERINTRLKELAKEVMPSLKTEIGALHLSKKGNGRVIWSYQGGNSELGPSQLRQRELERKTIAVRKVTALAEIRIKEAVQGITEADYKKAEEIIRLLFICFDEICPADYGPVSEDWTLTTDQTTDDGVVARLSVDFAIGVYANPYVYATVETVETFAQRSEPR